MDLVRLAPHQASELSVTLAHDDMRTGILLFCADSLATRLRVKKNLQTGLRDG